MDGWWKLDFIGMEAIKYKVSLVFAKFSQSTAIYMMICAHDFCKKLVNCKRFTDKLLEITHSKLAHHSLSIV